MQHKYKEGTFTSVKVTSVSKIVMDLSISHNISSLYRKTTVYSEYLIVNDMRYWLKQISDVDKTDRKMLSKKNKERNRSI